MRDPVLSRSSRGMRRRRSVQAIGVAVAVVAASAVVVSLVGGGGEEELPTPQVSFAGSFSGEGDRGQPEPELIEREGAAIIALLDGWYQRAFVDPALYGDGTFPEVAALFDEQARTSFSEDLDALTIGPAREEVKRVEPREATAAIAIFFEDGTEPRWATAEVRFTARATMKDDQALPLSIDQQVTLFLERAGDGWLVSTFYDATHEQRSVEPEPSPTGSPS